MAKVWKDILYPGAWHCRDGRIFNCQPKDIPYYAGRMKDMIAAGLPVPLSWEHQPDCKPGDAAEARAARAKFALGHAADVRADSGFLETCLEVPQADDAKRLPAVRFVSPYIEWDFVDGTGKKWDGPSITHIAVTPRPIQHTQKPFAMSHGADKAPIALSLSDYEGAMPDEKDKKKAPKPEAEPKPEETEETETEISSESEPPAEEAGASTDAAPSLTPEQVSQAVELLTQHKIVLGEDVTPANFFDRLMAALHTKGAHDGTGDGGANNPDTQAQATEVPMPGAAIGMSQEALQTENALLKGKLAAAEQAQLVGRIKSLVNTKRISKPMFDKLHRDATAVSLSLDSKGEVVPVPILAYVEAYEQLPAGTMGQFDPTALSAATECEPPAHLTKKDKADLKSQEEAGDELAERAMPEKRKEKPE